MRRILFVLLCLTAWQVNAQQNTEKEINQFILARNWDQVMMRSLNIMAEEPLQPLGYYYTALALCRQTEFAKAEGYNAKAFLFGDEKWKSKSRELGKQIQELKQLIPQPVNLDDINSLEAYQWSKLWQFDKSNINAGVNAVELLIRKNHLVQAAELLDDPALAKITGAKELRKKLSSNKEVAGADKLESYTKTGDAQFQRKDFEAALTSYKKALEQEPNNRQLPDKIEFAEDEIAWKSAQGKATVEAYETYLNRSGIRKYQKEAKAKIIDNLKYQIQTFAKRNEVDQAEAAYNKYVQRYRPSSIEKQELEKILCETYFSSIYALSDSKEKSDKQARLNLYYKARKICPLSEADKKEISKLEKSLN
ncbi:MAG: hypothetical protein ACTHMC_25985 [Pseudobacter sp.]|uniref:hypothetical protein n=1 Tax=Pseudobacter sp. TaxID=2045420 RepID=UPI003F806F15